MYALKSPIPQVMSNATLTVCRSLSCVSVTGVLLKALHMHGSYICHMKYFGTETCSFEGATAPPPPPPVPPDPLPMPG